MNAALKFTVAAYGEEVTDVAGKDFCASTIFGADNAPIAGTGTRPREFKGSN